MPVLAEIYSLIKVVGHELTREQVPPQASGLPTEKGLIPSEPIADMAEFLSRMVLG